MMRIAEKEARNSGCNFLITGENLSQVSSQTLTNLYAITKAVNIQILRPLLAYDKTEILKIAREIGTYEISIGPEACDVLGPKHPATTCDLKEIEDEIKTSKKEIEKLGTECLGFRAPHFITHPRMFSLLKKHGYVYDSSFSPSIFPGRYINLGKPKNIEIKEIPISKFMLKLPFSLSYIRAFYPLSMKFIPQKPRHFYLHPYEFLEKKPGKEIPFHVRQICKINQGKAAWKIFEEVINRLDTEFVSCRDYLKNKI